MRMTLTAGVIALAGIALLLNVTRAADPTPRAPSVTSRPVPGNEPRSAPSSERASRGKPTSPTVNVFVFDERGKLVGPVPSPLVVMTATQWRKQLTREQFQILRTKDTEAAFCGNLLDNKKEGVYTCAGCGLPVFSSHAKFDSGTGWPSFMQAVAKQNVEMARDLADGTQRVEIHCARCKGHLGHVFDDGPAPTGLRYCLNSASLQFTEKDALASLADPAAAQALAKTSAAEEAPASTPPAEDQPRPRAKTSGARTKNDTNVRLTSDQQASTQEAAMTETAVFAGGCFWCTEAAFQQLRGVSDVESGYAGGRKSNATYEQVSRGNTGHAEVIRVTYDPAKITFDQLLTVFFDAHDPTTLNRQGPDIGSQYRSAIFYANDEQKAAAEAKIKALTEARAYGNRRVVTKLEPLEAFYPAEDYHQDYVLLNPLQPYVQGHSIPKACSVQKKHPELMDPEKAARISAFAE